MPDGAGQFIWGGQIVQQDPNHIVLPYWPAFPMPIPQAPAAGFVVFNTQTGTIEQDVKMENRGVYPIGDGQVAVAHEGHYDIVDLATQQVVRTIDTSLPDDPQALPALRW